MGLTVYGGGGKPEEEKTVTAGASAIEVSPSSGKVMKKVTVNPTPTESKSVTPATTELTVTPSEGKHLSQVVVGAVEDVTPEVTAQTPVITQILEGLVGKTQGANATADKILEGYSAYVGQNLINGTLTKSGAYVWKKLTAEGGDFIDYVVSDSPTAYPDGAEQGGYWYEKINPFEVLLEATGCTKMAVDKFTFTSGTTLTTQVSHSLGQVPTLGFVYTSDEVENASPLPIKLHIASSNNGFLSYKRSDGTLFYGSSSSKIDTSKTTSDKLCFTASNIYQAGLEYTLITMA